MNRIMKKVNSPVMIRVTGKNIDNFVHRVIRNKINIYKYIPISYNSANIVINYSDLEVLYKIRSIYDIKIVKYYSFNRIIRFIYKNRFIFSFLIMGLTIIYILSNVIFSIDIISSNKKIVKLLEDELYYYGVRKYSFIKSYNKIEDIENKILNNNKDSLEWIEITRSGTKYIVRVEERVIKKEEDKSELYDIVAGKNAIVKRIVARRGEKVAYENAYIRKGEVAISSNVVMPDNTKTLVGADGYIIGEVWYYVNISYPYHYREISYTGRSKKVLAASIFNKKISFFDFHKYKSFDNKVKNIFKDNIFPISLFYEVQYETNVIDEVYDIEEAREKAIEKAKNSLTSKYDSILNIGNVTIVKEESLDSKIELELFIVADEDITSFRKIEE